MNKNIIISLSVIAAVAAIVIGGTTAYFSDTEVSVGNVFAAGTVDIHVTGDNFEWSEGAIMEDMKPCHTDYLNFTVYNDINQANPVNVWKKITITKEETGVVTEPECTDQEGVWNGETCDWGQAVDNNELSSAIWYDLYVEVYNDQDQRIWWQTIYVDEDQKTLKDIYGEDNYVFLGMIPVDAYMKVVQSYHMDPETSNWAQGDRMTFDIEVKAEQLHGEAWLENKTAAEPFKIIHDDGINGTLTYEIKNPTFDYSFSGRAPQANTEYSLIYYNGPYYPDPWPGEGSILIGKTTTDANGDFAVTDSVELDSNLPSGDFGGAKIFFVLSDDYDEVNNKMQAWHQADYLLEIGLIWYEDTDL